MLLPPNSSRVAKLATVGEARLVTPDGNKGRRGDCRVTGVRPRTLERCVAELEANGVFSRDQRGMIFSRRMIRDVKAFSAAQEAGSTRGNPWLLSDAGKAHEPPSGSQVAADARLIAQRNTSSIKRLPENGVNPSRIPSFLFDAWLAAIRADCVAASAHVGLELGRGQGGAIAQTI
jgi:hypothetical protein